MPKFALTKSDGSLVEIGVFASREAALNLRIFKDNPKLADTLVEVHLPKLPKVDKASNRWAVIFDGVEPAYLAGSYTSRAAVLEIIGSEYAKNLRKLPKYAYHAIADAEFSKQLSAQQE